MVHVLLLGLSLCLGVSLGQEANPSTPNVTRPVFLCGGEITGDSGYIASEGFPNNYLPNKKCVWKITVPEGHVVILSFRLLDMEADSSCRYDYLNIYNGHSDTDQRLARVCGTFRPGAVLSTGPHMMLEMVSDEGTAGRGFLAWYSAGAPHLTDDVYCGGKLEKPQGTITSPNWPKTNYPGGISCSWHIVAPKQQVIELSFGKMDIEEDSRCRYDYLAVYNGGQTDSNHQIGKFCGDTPPSTVYSDNNELLVQFVSDLSVTAGGFEVTYRMKDISELSKKDPESKATSSSGGTASRPTGTKAPLKTPPTPKATPKPTKPAMPKPTKPATPKPTPKPKPTRPKPTVIKPTAKPRPTKVPKPPSTGKPKRGESAAQGSSSKCPDKCRKTGTLGSHYCASQFVVTGSVRSVTKGEVEGTLLANINIINQYKTGDLIIQEAGKTASVQIINECPRCPILKKGGSYLFMGVVDSDGRGRILGDSFVIAYKAQQHQILTNVSKKPC